MDKPLNCTVKQPVLLTLGETKLDTSCGCRVVDITFPNIMNPEEDRLNMDENCFTIFKGDGMKVGEIRFKNYYVATLTVKVKYRSDQASRESGDQNKWKICLKRVRLMPDPHSEAGSHDYFSFTKAQFRCELHNITSLRLILQQPSPVWNDFKLEELRLFRSSVGAKVSSLPAWLLEEPQEKVQKKSVVKVINSLPEGKDAGGITDLEGLSASLQQLWALAEEVACCQTSQSLGRFEIMERWLLLQKY